MQWPTYGNRISRKPLIDRSSNTIMSDMFVIRTEWVPHTKPCKGTAVSKLSGISRFFIIERSFGLSSQVLKMILLKEQHHWYLQSTSKSRLTYFTIVELDLDFLIQSIEATFIPSTEQ